MHSLSLLSNVATWQGMKHVKSSGTQQLKMADSTKNTWLDAHMVEMALVTFVYTGVLSYVQLHVQSP